MYHEIQRIADHLSINFRTVKKLLSQSISFSFCLTLSKVRLSGNLAGLLRPRPLRTVLDSLFPLVMSSTSFRFPSYGSSALKSNSQRRGALVAIWLPAIYSIRAWALSHFSSMQYSCLHIVNWLFE
jgi:hypothetical protein